MCSSPGMGPVHLNEVDCTGFEKSITECSFSMDNESLGCSHEEDAGVRCNIPAMGFQQRVSHAADTIAYLEDTFVQNNHREYISEIEIMLNVISLVFQLNKYSQNNYNLQLKFFKL